MKTYWMNLNDRERWMLGGAVVVGFFYLLYAGVYSPLVARIEEQSLQLRENQATLVWMQQVRQKSASHPSPKTLSNGQLLSVLATQLKATSFHRYPHQLQQTGSGDIQLTFETVPYNAFINWLSDMNKQYTFTIQQLSVDHTDTPGIVKLALVVAVKQ